MSDIQDHLTNIEVKLSYLEDICETLNSVVIEQQERIDTLEKKLTLLKNEGLETKANEPPPHY